MLIAATCAAAAGTDALAQRPAQQKPVYDQYYPSKVLRTSRQGCMRDEEAIGAFCIRHCQKGYRLVPKSDPPRCRSIEPLPPGSLPGAIRQETGKAHKPPSKPPKPEPGE